MKRPSGNKARKVTDTQQVYLDSINGPVLPEVGKLQLDKCAPGKFAERTMRVGR